MKRIFSLFVITSWLIPAVTVNAQDVISRRDSRSGAINQFEGQVIDWDARRLVYDSNGREREIPSRQVVDVAYSRTAEQVDGDTYFESGKFTPALLAYENAIREEPRQWVQRNIRAQRLQCAAAMGQIETALNEFFKILQSAEQTRHFHLIPLAWQKREISPRLAQQLQTWLEGTDEIRTLIAASWLFISDSERAIEKLNQLKQSTRPEIAHLATAQLWRTDIITVDTAGLRRWYSAIDLMPSRLRAGPVFLLGRAESRQAEMSGGDVDPALVTLMRIPVLYPEQYQLAGSALLECHRILQQASRIEEAEIMKQQLQRNFRFSIAAGLLQQKIEVIDN